MAKYTVRIYGYGAYKDASYSLVAPNDDAMRRIAIQKYGYVLRDTRTGMAIEKEGSTYDYGYIRYHFKRWYWATSLGSGWDFEINPHTGGKMDRYVEGYDVEYLTIGGTRIKQHMAYENIERVRYSLMEYDKYKNAKRNFTIYKSGKKMGTLNLAPTGKWVWTSASGTKYYVGLNGYITSQKR